MNIEERLRIVIRDVENFPKEGILFKDITPILQDAALCKDITDKIVENLSGMQLDAIAAVEARGFFFGILLAQQLGLPFIPIRKAGKLPYKIVTYQYALEYGLASVEMHEDAVQKGMKVLVHDDLLATGGTAEAAASLIQLQGGEVSGFSFIVELDFLKGRETLKSYSPYIDSLVRY